MSRPIKTFREFEDFRLNVETKILWHRDKMVEIPVKAVEVLIELTARPGDVLRRDELLDAVWGDAFIEETNLSRNIYILRKTLKRLSGRDFIKTLPRRGYRFDAEVKEFIEHDELTLERSSFSQTVIELGANEPAVQPHRHWQKRTGIFFALGILLFSISGFSVWRFSEARDGVS